MNKYFQNLIEILDKELEACAKLKELFEAKKETLKKAKPDDLGVLDNQILALNNKIMKLDNSRKELAIEKFGKDAVEKFPEYEDIYVDKGEELINPVSEVPDKSMSLTRKKKM